MRHGVEPSDPVAGVVDPGAEDQVGCCSEEYTGKKKKGGGCLVSHPIPSNQRLEEGGLFQGNCLEVM